jgi:alpha-methylacyl-CoA racemase
MQRLGLDFARLKEIQPNLIYCSITGYGQTGPLKDRAGHDINYLALSGLASFSGREETGPVLSGAQIADVAGGSHNAVMAILAAVIQRATTHEGQYLDISMSDAAMALTTMAGANALTSGEDPGYGTDMLNGGLFYNYYQTSDHRHISIGSLEPNFALALLSLLELEEWQSKVGDQSPAMQKQIRAAISDKVGAQSLAHWQAEFAKVDACVEPVLTMNEAFKHPHFIERGMVTRAIDSNNNEIEQINTSLPFKRQEAHKAGGKLGADTLIVMQTLGYSAEQIAELKKNRCI